MFDDGETWRTGIFLQQSSLHTNKRLVHDILLNIQFKVRDGAYLWYSRRAGVVFVDAVFLVMAVVFFSRFESPDSLLPISICDLRLLQQLTFSIF